MSVAPTNWRKCAIKLVGAGIGTAVAGPLGTALGGALGGLFGEQAEKLFAEYTGAGGEKLAEFGVHYCYDQLREMQEHPPLEAVVREALRHALEDVRQDLEYDRKEAYANWFESWVRRLSGLSAIQLDSLSDVVGKLASGALAADPNGTELALDQLFRRAMERLDGEGRAQQNADAGGPLSITAAASFRAMPDPLLQLLTERLPAPLDARFRGLVALPEHHRAWIAVQQSFQDDARSAFAELIAATRRIDERTERILEFQERQLQRAQDEKRIAQEEVRAERAEKQEWVNKYVKLMEDVAARKGEPREPSLAALLEMGDLEGAIRLKTSQIDKRKGEVKKLAQDWSELGRVHDLRFAWRDAMECYRQAWQLDPNEPGYGFPYAYFARGQPRGVLAQCRHHAEQPGDTVPRHAADEGIRDRLPGGAGDSPEAARGQPRGVLARRRHDAEQPGASVQRHAADEGIRDRLPGGAGDLPAAGRAQPRGVLALCRWPAEQPGESVLRHAADEGSETAYLEALATYRRLAEANPEAYLPYVATTLNNLAILYRGTQRMKESEQSCGEAEAICEPLWRQQPELHGNQMARIFLLRAVLASSERRVDACNYARRGLDAAFDPNLKGQLQQMVDTFCVART